MAQEEISPRASLVVIGQRFQQMGLWAMVEKDVTIKQKVLLHTPLDKLKDCLINILAGGTDVPTEPYKWRLDGRVVPSSRPSVTP